MPYEPTLSLDAVEMPDLSVHCHDLTAHRKAGDFYMAQYRDVRQAQNCLEQAINAYMCDVELNDCSETLAKLAKAYALNGQLATAAQYVKKTLSHAKPTRDALKKAYEVDAFLQTRYAKPSQAYYALKKALRYESPLKQGKLHLAMAGLHLNQLESQFKVSTAAALALRLGLGTTLCLFGLKKTPLKAKLDLLRTRTGNLFRSEATALTALFTLHQAYPGLEAVTLEIGTIYQKQNMTAEAAFWFERACERHPIQDDGYRKLVNLHQSVQNVAQGIAVLKKWLAVRPEDSELQLVLSHALSATGEGDQVEPAIFYARQALLRLTCPQERADAYCHLGALLLQTQNMDAAITAYQAALHSNPSHTDAIVQLGTLYYDRQDFALSQQIFENALPIMPNNARVLCNLGYLAWMQNNIDGALHYYERSTALDPSYDIALNNLGVLYLDHIGDVRKAITLFDQTLQHNPTYALCHYNKGRAYSFLGNTIDAAQCFQQAQALNRENPELDSKELSERIQQLFDLNSEVS